jgi:glycosyltransferase involved in cell wall biosynthesis
VKGGLVSVVIPFYNPGAYLAEAVASVLGQAYRPLEVLLVDDGSTDGSADVAARLAGSGAPVRLLRLATNQGPAAARNAGLRAARGDYVTFLDADDLMVADRLAIQTAHLAAHQTVDAVVGLADNVLEPGVVPPVWLRWIGTGIRPDYAYAISVLTYRGVFDRVGLFDPALRVGEDTDWMLRARAAGVRIARIDRVLLRRRIHGANLSYRTAEMRAAAHRSVLRLARQRIAQRDGAGGAPCRPPTADGAPP